jgi:plasmid stabilization system protein ParE
LNSEFQPEADEEFREAARYYESEAPGVGLAFVVEVHKAVADLAGFPLTAQIVRGSIRKRVLPHFPYYIFYSIEPDKIVIIAVAHQRRRPNYWLSRLNK